MILVGTHCTGESLGAVETQLGKRPGPTASVCRYFYGDASITLARTAVARWRDWLARTFAD